MMGNLSARVIAGIVAAIVAIAVIWAAFHFWEKSRSQGAQSRVDHAQGEAMSTSANDAVDTTAAAGKRESQSEDLTRSNEREIRAAPGASDRVNAGVDAAGRAALCRRAAYREDPKCKGAKP
jgi:Flp pilus assembly protein TadB